MAAKWVRVCIGCPLFREQAGLAAVSRVEAPAVSMGIGLPGLGLFLLNSLKL